MADTLSKALFAIINAQIVPPHAMKKNGATLATSVRCAETQRLSFGAIGRLTTITTIPAMAISAIKIFT